MSIENDWFDNEELHTWIDEQLDDENLDWLVDIAKQFASETCYNHSIKESESPEIYRDQFRLTLLTFFDVLEKTSEEPGSDYGLEDDDCSR